MCCPVDISATDRSLVQRSPTECGVSECDRETSFEEAPTNQGGPAMIIYIYLYIYLFIYLYSYYDYMDDFVCVSLFLNQFTFRLPREFF